MKTVEISSDNTTTFPILHSFRKFCTFLALSSCFWHWAVVIIWTFCLARDWSLRSVMAPHLTAFSATSWFLASFLMDVMGLLLHASFMLLTLACEPTLHSAHHSPYRTLVQQTVSYSSASPHMLVCHQPKPTWWVFPHLCHLDVTLLFVVLECFIGLVWSWERPKGWHKAEKVGDSNFFFVNELRVLLIQEFVSNNMAHLVIVLFIYSMHLSKMDNRHSSWWQWRSEIAGCHRPEPDSVVISDCWKVYDQLDQKGIYHLKVSHTASPIKTLTWRTYVRYHGKVTCQEKPPKV